MTRCRLVAGYFHNLSQKNAVLNMSVAGVTTVAGFFRRSYEREINRRNAGKKQPNKFKSAATLATVATAPAGKQKICDKFTSQVATNLQQVVTAVLPCP